MKLMTFSRGIFRGRWVLEALLRADIVLHRLTRPLGLLDAVIGWGCKPNTQRARAWASAHRVPYWSLEDGFVRSFGTGAQGFAPLSLVLDRQGIFYDTSAPNDLADLLNSAVDPCIGLVDELAAAKELIASAELSKYNEYDGALAALLPDLPADAVLVVDQTEGDLSVTRIGATRATFEAMLAAALAEHPGRPVILKTHPEVSVGHKRGYLTEVVGDERLVVVRARVNPVALLKRVRQVYVVSSTLGFEALLLGKPVACFGRAWYAGWGVTDDRFSGSLPRQRTRTVDELFASAYFHYARYLDPVRHERGCLQDVLTWLALQPQALQRIFPMTATAERPAVWVLGCRRWKVQQLRQFFRLGVAKVERVAGVQDLPVPPQSGVVMSWGARAWPGLTTWLEASGAHWLRVEDGFIRSVGLGSDLIAPLSLVVDRRGIYFDPRQASDLEVLLNETPMTPDLIARAQAVRAMVVRHQITKYNVDRLDPVTWPKTGRRVVLVPGQVEDDASIVLGSPVIQGNLALLRAVRSALPEAWIVYKPHPDVLSRNRRGRVAEAEAKQWADHIEYDRSVIACIEACDEVHTMTSLSGFDALLRGKAVVTYGVPFYAGWGLTTDRCHDHPAWARRTRRLSLDQLVAASLLLYPIYWDEALTGYTTCEATLHRIIAQRAQAQAQSQRQGRLLKFVLSHPWGRYGVRQWRKARVLAAAW